MDRRETIQDYFMPDVLAVVKGKDGKNPDRGDS